MKWRAASLALLVAAMALVAAVRLQPARVGRLDERSRQWFTLPDAGGRERMLLGDYDSYAWLRIARNWLRTGSPCGTIVDGDCRDELTLAPVGASDPYARSLHPAAIATLHRVVVFFDAEIPLASSAFLVTVIVGVLGVPPAFLLGRRLAGTAGGWIAALAISLQPAALRRTFGADNDVWNVTVPLWLVWAAANALGAQTRRSQVLWATAAAGLVALQAMAWSGWAFPYAIVLGGMTATVVLALVSRLARGGEARDATAPALVLVVFWVLTGLLTHFIAGGDSYWRIPLNAVSALGASFAPPEVSDAVVEDAWPSAFGGVGELLRPGFGSIVRSAGGRSFLVLACTGLLLLALAAPRRLRSPSSRGAAVLALVWFAGAFLLALRARRFGLLLTSPFGLAVGVGVGRLAAWLDQGLDRFRKPIRVLTRAIVFAGIACLAYFIGERGWSTAVAYRPAIHRPWAEGLLRIHDGTPREAVVFAWWDYGHWIKYFADRRVAADGSTLNAHVHVWVARALAATDERRTVGLLRMLACGSDATPYPEGAHGAYGKLRAAGMSDERARSAIEHLASVDRGQASRWLRSSGVNATHAESVLASTHCAAPPAYLVIDRTMTANDSWRELARWRGEVALDGYVRAAWAPCERAAGSSQTTCRLRGRFGTNSIVESLVASTEDWGSSRLHLRSERHDVRAHSPAEVLVVGSEGIEGSTPISPGLPISVLIDAQANRVLAGPSDLLRSTFTALMFLDGRHSRYFELFERRRGGPVTWAVRWPD